ncbi:MAG: hypothetical protein HOL04_04945 [Gammaproteobacteria bacterium]|jgi:hypothetical protein|nr:hypothetical protein [Gammaproteobacteria bacterium]MBT4607038.1 hypothetical protein [Thiotrichales bacterium]MBT3472606.1 hypothetical protein [Gammaproteobacteria bacterium]MBT3966605.1 hypothetical protein [Gammaproteobacteria bacterium]MBT4081790.1 hypothetical protein [Gammaproteobacteria bacterium]
MIDISIKMPPAPTPPKHSGVDPVTTIPRSHRVDETESDREHEQPQKRKKEHHSTEHQPQQDKSSVDESHPHIDNYA